VTTFDEVVPLIRTGAIFLILPTLLACGEFHTERYYQDTGERDLSEDLAAVDQFDPSTCDELFEAKLAGLTPVQLRQHEPAAVALFETALPKSMELIFSTSADLPAGLFLSPTAGTIAGFPTVHGTFQATVRVAALRPLQEGETKKREDPCVQPSELELTLEILPGCETAEDCLALPGYATACKAPGQCIWTAPGGKCPGNPGANVEFGLSDAPDTYRDELFELISHHQLTAEELSFPGLAGYSHQLLLGAGEDLLWTLPYSLANHWPVPFEPGDQMRLIHDILAPARLTLLAPAREMAVLLYNGSLPLAGIEKEHEDDLDIAVRRANLDCLVENDSHQCAPRGKDLLIFSSSSGTPVSPLGSGDSDQWDIEGRPFELLVTGAYSHLGHKEGCDFLIPSWASFQAFPLASCPIARVGQLQPVVLWPEDESIPVILSGADSFAHLGGEIQDYEWTLEQQPFPGLVGLTDPGAGKGTTNARFILFPATAAGTYNVHLRVTSADGQKGCVPALSQVRVLAAPDIDLRVELVWWTETDDLAVDADLDLLLMHPIPATLLGDAVWQNTAWEDSAGEKWVCSEKNPNPADWAALPEEEGTLCRVAAGSLTEGLPEVATVARLDRDKKTNHYPLAIRASLSNPGIVFAGMRVFINSVPKYETTRQPLLPGQIWQAGHVDVEFMKFVPHKNGKKGN